MSRMSRIYSNYTAEEVAAMEARAKEMNLSPSAYQKYITLLSTDLADSSTSLPMLMNLMLNALSNLKSGDVFISSSLLPTEWPHLNRSVKNTLSQALSRQVRNNPSTYIINQILESGINQYKKI